MNIQSIIKIGISSLILSGCTMTSSQYASDVEVINSRYDSMVRDPMVNEHASVALKKAEESIEELNDLSKSGAEDEEIGHQLYLTEKRLSIAEETAKMNNADEYIKNAELERQKVLLQASRREARQARAYAEEMREKASKLEDEVSNLKTRETERGLVMTLSDILFEFDSDKLKPGAARSLEKVARLLKEYPERDIMVEGFTDSLGKEEYNEDLSKERAASVKQHLIDRGVAASRIDTRGYGEDFPVASNNTDSGRQQNRRVEIVISNETNQPVSDRRS